MRREKQVINSVESKLITAVSIYQEIWDADQQQNGIPAIRQSDLQSARDSTTGFAIVDETASGTDARVISEVVIPDDKRATYDLCARLFDNYTLDPGIRDDITSEKSIEEREFIRAIIPTKPLQLAKEFIARDLDQEFTDIDLALAIEKTWFLQGKSGGKFASGFEHVFVGEQKSKGDQPDDVAVELGGYHFWYKYYLDDGGRIGDLELDDRITYGETEYSPSTSAQGRMIPEVITISFRWTAPDTLNRSNQLLKKPIGGFWVGCSPEGLIALGLVRVLTSAGSQAIINSSTYDLVFHALTNNASSIRTLYPEFKRTDFINIEPSDGDRQGEEADTSPETEPVTSGFVKIASAVVNPLGDEAGKETVTLLNTAPDAVNLDNWQIVAPNGWKVTFADVTIPGGDSRRFRMISSEPQFRNKGGTITLLEADATVHYRVSYSEEQGSRQGMSIVF